MTAWKGAFKLLNHIFIHTSPSPSSSDTTQRRCERPGGGADEREHIDRRRVRARPNNRTLRTTVSVCCLLNIEYINLNGLI